jgi:hypothetical protein
MENKAIYLEGGPYDGLMLYSILPDADYPVIYEAPAMPVSLSIIGNPKPAEGRLAEQPVYKRLDRWNDDGARVYTCINAYNWRAEEEQPAEVALAITSDNGDRLNFLRLVRESEGW